MPDLLPKADTINTECPLMDDSVDPDHIVTYQGHRIGLCCEDCVPDWNKLTGAEKDAHLAKMLKR